MITTTEPRLERLVRQRLLSRKQERKTSPHSRRSLTATTLNSFLFRTQPTTFPSIRSILGQAAEYRARPAGRQLGAEILELSKKNPPKPSFYITFFSTTSFNFSFRS